MKQIQLTQGKFALVDDEDFDKVNEFKWYFSPSSSKCQETGYAYSRPYIGGGRKNQKCATILMHRIILGTDNQTSVDHKDRNGLNNQKSNLRVCTQSQNMANRPAKSGYKGVHKNRKGTFVAQITKNKRCFHLGTFETPELAAIAYNEACKIHHGEFGFLNSI